VKIDKPSKPIPAASLSDGSARADNKGKTGTPASLQQPSSTSVSLGAAATQLQSMESSMASSPVADAAKVAEIRQAISDGRFKVDSTLVADRLIETVRELIGSQQSLSR
jgi:negative regulator of flagellin synthesis FlgM